MSLPEHPLPARLTAPEPGWTTRADVVVIGSGIAGLTAALRVHAGLGAAARPGESPGRVLVVTKDVLHAGSTQWAQGGIAAALGPEDTPAEHERDTLVAGAGACDLDAVRALATEGPEAVRELIALGTQFDHSPDGVLSLTREGGHHRDRIAHAGGDATGAEIQRALIAAVQAAPEIEVIEHALAVDLLLDEERAVAGVTLHVMGEGQRDGVGAVLCRAVVLASGGLGQVFSQTTNPAVSTGDGLAVALRAGAALRDLEFVQFHPTVMYLGPESRGQQPLISEAVRGEGAFLVDFEGRRFMQGEHELADLAPRDVVAKAITRRMHESDHPHMWLDARHLGRDFWQRRFPTVLASCLAHGVDPVTDLIPVAPACHYASGGVATDLWGRTRVPGLYATGEVACSGVHGANRLASNSLLEGLVFSRRIADVLPRELRPWAEPAADTRAAGLVPGAVRRELQEVMTARVGVLRSADGLAEAARVLDELAAPSAGVVDQDAWETTNLVTISTALVAAASLREETRGSHWREDFPARDDSAWSGHFDLSLRSSDPAAPSALDVTFSTAAPTDLADAGARSMTHRTTPRTTQDRSSAVAGIAALPVGELPAGLVDELTGAGLDAARVHADVAAAVAEDLPGDDVTSWATIPAEQRGTADLVARQDGTVAGLAVAELVLRHVLGHDVDVERPVADGTAVRRGDVLLSATGATALLLTAERTALNYAGHLSGVATATAAWVAALEGTGARVRDTRKTIPHFRALEKYAVRCGGGVNHRATLSDQALVKDNHVLAAGGVVEAYELIRARYPDVPVQVEVTTLAQLEELLAVGADQVLLDNMSTEQMAEAVRLTAGRATLEASGGLSLEQARAVAATGVDFLAVGALTHSAPVMDIAMDLRPGALTAPDRDRP